MHKTLCEFLFSKFDTQSLSLCIGGNNARVSLLEVHYILGLPSIGLDVNIVGEEAEYDQLYMKFFKSTKTHSLS